MESLCEKPSLVVPNNKLLVPTFEYNGENHNLEKFNLIYGGKISDRIAMLQGISEILKEPIYSPLIYDTESLGRLVKLVSSINSDELKQYYTYLFGSSGGCSTDPSKFRDCRFMNLSILSLAAILTSCKDNNDSFVLLDNMPWGKSSVIHLNVIRTLHYYAHQVKPVVVVSPDIEESLLTKKRIYKPNIIALPN